MVINWPNPDAAVSGTTFMTTGWAERVHAASARIAKKFFMWVCVSATRMPRTVRYSRPEIVMIW